MSAKRTITKTESLFTMILSISVLATTVGSIISTACNAQTPLVPAKNSFQKKWIKNEMYQMTWYAIKDTAKFEIGKVSTHIEKDRKSITIVTHVNMKNVTTTWVDSTVANIKTLQPIYHASYNMQRDMVLNFGKIVTGFYNDKIKKQNKSISDSTTNDYFDSNIYPALIRWLPLKDGYKQVISIYDYNPNAKTGVIKAYIKSVSSGAYQSTKAGTRPVWVVTVNDEIGNQAKTASTYYIDKRDRRLWRQEINVAGRKMVMECVE